MPIPEAGHGIEVGDNLSGVRRLVVSSTKRVTVESKAIILGEWVTKVSIDEVVAVEHGEYVRQRRN